MKNNEITKRFFSVTSPGVKRDVLAIMAKHYGVTETEAEAEVLDDEAESLLDYLTGGTRTATYVLMQRHGLA